MCWLNRFGPLTVSTTSQNQCVTTQRTLNKSIEINFSLGCMVWLWCCLFQDGLPVKILIGLDAYYWGGLLILWGLQKLMLPTLTTLLTWTIRHLVDETINPAYYIEDCRILDSFGWLLGRIITLRPSLSWKCCSPMRSTGCFPNEKKNTTRSLHWDHYLYIKLSMWFRLV